MDHAIGHRNQRRCAAGLDRLADLGVAMHDLLVARLEHAREHLLDVFDERVDDVVLADADALKLGGAFRRQLRCSTLKAMTIALDASARLTSLTLTLPRPEWMTFARVSVWSPSFSSELVIGSTLP